MTGTAKGGRSGGEQVSCAKLVFTETSGTGAAPRRVSGGEAKRASA